MVTGCWPQSETALIIATAAPKNFLNKKPRIRKELQNSGRKANTFSNSLRRCRCSLYKKDFLHYFRFRISASLRKNT